MRGVVAVGALPVAAAVLLVGFADPRRPECGLVVEPGEVPRLRSVVCLAGGPCRHVFMVRSGQIRRRRGGWRMARWFPAVIVSGCRAWVRPEEEGESCGADARPPGRIQGRSGGLHGPVTATTMRAWSLPCSWSRQLLLSGGWSGIRGGGPSRRWSSGWCSWRYCGWWWPGTAHRIPGGRRTVL